MTDSTFVSPPEVQAAINSLYHQAFEAGRLQGREEGIIAAVAHMSTLTANQIIAKSGAITVPASLTADIEVLEFSVRTYNCLKREGLHTIGKLLNYSDFELLDIRNFGGKCVEEVRTKLDAVGHTLRHASGYNS